MKPIPLLCHGASRHYYRPLWTGAGGSRGRPLVTFAKKPFSRKPQGQALFPRFPPPAYSSLCASNLPVNPAKSHALLITEPSLPLLSSPLSSPPTQRGWQEEPASEKSNSPTGKGGQDAGMLIRRDSPKTGLICQEF